jgi:hypothetical protein
MELKTMSASSNNPLAKHFRQPILYIKLPSQGRWYPAGTVDIPVTGDIPVYAMTAKDEITLKTPDALMNGSGTASVIASCCPSIKDPWKMPVVDLDTLLLAIRLATYGKELDFTATCPHCETEQEKTLDLTVLMGNIRPGDWATPLQVGDLSIGLRPHDYEHYNNNNQKSFDEQRLLKAIQRSDITEEEKNKQIEEIFSKMLSDTINQFAYSVEYIITADGQKVANPAFIREFLNNCDKSVWDAIKGKLTAIKEQSTWNDIHLTCENPECGQDYVVPFVFEQTNFFD